MLTVTNAATDADQPANVLSYALVNGPAGAVISATGVITWTPGENQGPSTNTIVSVVNDGTVSVTNSFVVVVTEVNQSPVAVSESYTVSNATLTVLAPGVLANDVDVDLPANILTAVLISGPTNGVLTLNTDGGFTYSPNIGFGGQDAFTYYANDGQTNSSPVSVVLTVVQQGFQITSVTKTGTLATVTWRSQTGMRYRVLYKDNLMAANWSVVPGDMTAAGISTSKNDTVGLVAQRFYRVMILSNSAPQLAAQNNLTLPELTTLSVTNAANDADLPQELLTYTLIASPSGSAISSAGVISWTPTELQGGTTNTFTTRVTDNGGLSATNSFEVVVTEVNQAPVAVNNSYTLTNTSLTVIAPGVLGNDSDSDIPANTLTAVLVIGTTNGALTLHPDGSFVYTPTTSFNGVDIFTYRVNDGFTNSTIATVTINVTNLPALSMPNFSITSVTMTNAAATVTWQSEASMTYRLQYKTNILDPVWENILPDVVATGGLTSKTNAVGDEAHRFYRVMRLP